MFITALFDFIEELNSGKEMDEWYLANFIQDNVNTLSEVEAFEMSSHLIKLIQTNLRSSELYELLQIWIALQRQSGTIQEPLALVDDPNILKRILELNAEDYIVNAVYTLQDIYK